MRPRTIREQIKKDLRSMLAHEDMPARDCLEVLKYNRRTLRHALNELGGEVYRLEGQYWWRIDSKLKKGKRILKDILKKARGNILKTTAVDLLKMEGISERYAIQAAKELGIKVEGKIHWVLLRRDQDG